MPDPRIKEAPDELEAWWYRVKDLNVEQDKRVRNARSLGVMRGAKYAFRVELALAVPILLWVFRHELFKLWGWM